MLAIAVRSLDRQQAGSYRPYRWHGPEAVHIRNEVNGGLRDRVANPPYGCNHYL
ncbi:hypothetical protein GCM10009304_32240 [Pseudomonas matsuisoli]|uniref:Uncharacterized protein n=1 Tax=Pseudomonas matsuisoli TaxID=1515666 RepID=A0A917Q0L5_9PSED|nr:hypothetical protein GCM10009304_32240 [Pseudomonas matsuisoli]